MSFQPICSSIYTSPSSTPKLSETKLDQDSHPIKPILSSTRVSEVFNREVEIANLDGDVIKTVRIKPFLIHLLAELKGIGVNPSYFQIVGGAVAYLIGVEKAANYAEVNRILNPNLAEFNRLQDLDISIHLTGYPDQTLYKMAFCIARALTRSGLPGSEYEIYQSIFFRKKVVDGQGLAILSLGNPNKFWLDFSFFTRLERSNFSTRDHLATEISGYLNGSINELIWTGDPADPFLAVDHRLRKVLEIKNIKTVNHLGLPLLAMYLSKGYHPLDTYYFYPLAEKFVSYHLEGGKKYIDTFYFIKNNHLGNDLDVFAKLAATCYRVLSSYPNPNLTEWIESENFVGDSPECRYLTFIQNKGAARYQMNHSDLKCLAEIMGITPHLPITGSEWRNFLAAFDLDSTDRLQLLGSLEPLSVQIAKKILENKWDYEWIKPEQCFEILEKNLHLEDLCTFMAVKFKWEMQNHSKNALQTWKMQRSALPEDLVEAFLNKMLNLPCETLEPYFLLIFKEKINKPLWVKKLLDEKFFNEAISYVLFSKDLNLHIFLVDQLIHLRRFAETDRCIKSIKDLSPELYQTMSQDLTTQGNLIALFFRKQKEFNSMLKRFLDAENYKAAEIELEKSENFFEVDSEVLEKLLILRGLAAFNDEEYKKLEFYIEQAIQNEIKTPVLSEFTNKLVLSAGAKGALPSQGAWILNYFITSKASKLCTPDLLIQLAIHKQDKLPFTKISAWLLFALKNYNPSSANAILVNLCIRFMKINKITINRSIIPHLNNFVIQLIENKKIEELTLLSKELYGLKTTLSISTETLFLLVNQINSNETLDHLLQYFSEICPLPSEIERPFIERSIIKLVKVDLQKAQALFREKKSFWNNQLTALRGFFDQLPNDSNLKFEIFFMFPIWKKDDWNCAIQALTGKHELLFQILMDNRSTNLIEQNSIIEKSILENKWNLKQSQRLVERFSFLLLNPEFVEKYFKRISQAGFPQVLTKQFIASYASIHTNVMISPIMLSQMEDMLTKLHEKDPFDLVHLIVDLVQLESKFPEDKKRAFFHHYFNLYPVLFESIYSSKERAGLNKIIDKYSIETPSTVAIGLTDSSSARNNDSIKVVLKNKFYTKKILENLLVNNQFEVLKEIISDQQFQALNQRGDLTLKEFVNKFIIKLLQNSQVLNANYVKETLDYILKISKLCLLDEPNLDPLLKNLAVFIGKTISQLDGLDVLLGDNVDTYFDAYIDKFFDQLMEITSKKKSTKVSQKNSSKMRFLLLLTAELVSQYSEALKIDCGAQLAEKIIFRYSQICNKIIPESYRHFSSSIHQFIEVFFSEASLKHHNDKIRYSAFLLMMKCINQEVFGQDPLNLLKTTNFFLQSPLYHDEKGGRLNLIALISKKLYANKILTNCSDKELISEHQALFQELKKFGKLCTYGVHPADPLFSFYAMTLDRNFKYGFFSGIPKYYLNDYNSWLIYLNQPLDEILTSEEVASMLGQISNDFPKEFLSENFSNLIKIYDRQLSAYNFDLCPVSVSAFFSILNLYKINELTGQELEKLTQSLALLLKELDLKKAENFQEERNKVAEILFKNLLKWQTLPYKSEKAQSSNSLYECSSVISLDIMNYFINTFEQMLSLRCVKSVSSLLIDELKDFTGTLMIQLRQKKIELNLEWSKQLVRLLQIIIDSSEVMLPRSCTEYNALIIEIFKIVFRHLGSSTILNLLPTLEARRLLKTFSASKLKALITYQHPSFVKPESESKKLNSLSLVLDDLLDTSVVKVHPHQVEILKKIDTMLDLNTKLAKLNSKSLVLQHHLDALVMEFRGRQTEILEKIDALVVLNTKLTKLKILTKENLIPIDEAVASYIIRLLSKEPKSTQEAIDVLNWVHNLTKYCYQTAGLHSKIIEHVSYYIGMVTYHIAENNFDFNLEHISAVTTYTETFLDPQHGYHLERSNILPGASHFCSNNAMMDHILKNNSSELSVFNLIIGSFFPYTSSKFKSPYNEFTVSSLLRFLDLVFSHSKAPKQYIDFILGQAFRLFNNFIYQGFLSQKYTEVISLVKSITKINISNSYAIEEKSKLFDTILNHLNNEKFKKSLFSNDALSSKKQIQDDMECIMSFHIFSIDPEDPAFAAHRVSIVSYIASNSTLFTKNAIDAWLLYLNSFYSKDLKSNHLSDLFSFLMIHCPKPKLQKNLSYLLELIQQYLKHEGLVIENDLILAFTQFLQIQLKLTSKDYDSIQVIFTFLIKKIHIESEPLASQLAHSLLNGVFKWQFWNCDITNESLSFVISFIFELTKTKCHIMFHKITFTFLDKYTTHVIKKCKTENNFKEFFIDLFMMIIKPKDPLMKLSRFYWEPIYVNICLNIINFINKEESRTLLKSLTQIDALETFSQKNLKTIVNLLKAKIAGS